MLKIIPIENNILVDDNEVGTYIFSKMKLLIKNINWQVRSLYLKKKKPFQTDTFEKINKWYNIVIPI